jgi:hypothetical protein
MLNRPVFPAFVGRWCICLGLAALLGLASTAFPQAPKVIGFSTYNGSGLGPFVPIAPDGGAGSGAVPRPASTALKFVTFLDQFDLQNALAGGGTVEFQVAGILALTSTLNITNDTILDGNGQAITLSGSNVVQVFHVHPGVNFTLRNLSVVSGSNQLGAAIFNDQGTTLATNVTFSGNIASGQNGSNGGTSSGGTGQNGGNGGAAYGGAIYNTGQFEMDGCEMDNNAALGGAGGDGGSGGGGEGGNGGNGGDGGLGYGGGIFNSGTLIISTTELTSNQAVGGVGGTNGVGNGLYVYSGQGGGGASGLGGGIYNTGLLVVTNCSFVTNSVTGGGSQSSGDGNGKSGGAALGGGIYNSGTLIAGNSTFSANATQAGSGGSGGSANTDVGNGGNGGEGAGGAVYTLSSADFLNCTLAGGSVAGGTNGLGGNDGEFFGTAGSPGASLGANLASGGGTTSLRNTILAYATNAGNASGTLTDKGHNLSSDSSAGFKAAGSKNNTDPLIQAAADNGGTNAVLQTMALSPGSPAIAAGDPAVSPPFDERGVARSATFPSIGAFEFNSFTVEGAVYQSNSPQFGVRVSLGTMTTGTDTNGNYSFTGLTAGVYPINLSLYAPGYMLFPGNQNLGLTNSAETTVVFNPALYLFDLEILAPAAGGAAQLQLFGGPSEVVTLQASVDLVHWTALGNHTLNGSGLLNIADSTSTNVPHRFYRTIPVP